MGRRHQWYKTFTVETEIRSRLNHILFNNHNCVSIKLGHQVKHFLDEFEEYHDVKFGKMIDLEWLYFFRDVEVAIYKIQKYNETIEPDQKIYDDKDNNVVNDRNYDIVIANVKSWK